MTRRRRPPRAAAALIVFIGASTVGLATARSLPPPPLTLRFAVVHDRPVSGQVFSGLGIIVLDPTSTTIDRVLCDAQIGSKILHGRQRVLFADVRRSAPVAEIVCSWRIPEHSVGQRLRLKDNGHGPRATVYVNHGASVLSSPVFSWTMRRG